MYSRFLKEAAKITGNQILGEASEMFDLAGKRFTEIGLSFEDAEKARDNNEKIQIASRKFQEIAEIEENAYNLLNANI